MSTQICKYFLSKGCRYGDRCRFLHEYPEEEYDFGSRYATRNPYVYLADEHQRNGTSGPSVEKNLITETVAYLSQEVKQIERSGMWPLTVIGCANQGNVPGWKDYSPEEIRWANYLAAGNGSLQKFMQEWQSLLRKASDNRKTFTSPTKQTVEIVKTMVEKKLNTPEPVKEKNQPFPTTLSGSVFGMLSDPIPGLFSQVLQPKPADSFNQPLFSKVASSQTQSIFGNTSQPGGFNRPGHFPSVFENQPSAFGNSTPTVDDLQMQECEVDDPNQNTRVTHSVFGQQTPVIEKNVFGQVPKIISFTTSTTFGSKPVTSVFGNATPTEPLPDTFESKIYSKLSDLTEEEIEQFKAQTFTHQKVPLKPPPRELCVP